MTSFVYVLTYVSTHLLKTYLPTNLCTQATHARMHATHALTCTS